ncbi:hypothetical protein E2542_SST08266 [Spatholobus suberectus]|nr:hypothetical protein E2542_SST08266 [Spatholobus suberectus]
MKCIQIYNKSIRLSCTPTSSSFHYPAALNLLAALIDDTAFHIGMLFSSSITGCSFPMLAFVNLAQIKLRTLVCGSSHAYIQLCLHC